MASGCAGSESARGGRGGDRGNDGTGLGLRHVLNCHVAHCRRFGDGGTLRRHGDPSGSLGVETLRHDDGDSEDEEEHHSQPDREPTSRRARSAATCPQTAAARPVAGGGAPTQGGFFWAGGEVEESGKLRSTFSAAVTSMIVVEFPVPVKPVYSSPTS